MCMWCKQQRIINRLFAWVLLFACGGYLFHLLFVVNTTESFPPGLYRKVHHKIPRKGELVLFCPPDTPIVHEALQRRYLAHGLCPAGTGYMIKRIVGIAGDFVSISEEGVSVNSQRLPMSARRIHMDNAVPPLARRLKSEEFLLMSPHPLSFDGRYIGPLMFQIFETSRQLTPLTPVYTWEN